MAVRGMAQPKNGEICRFKLLLLGESAVGKSSLVLRFVKGWFHESVYNETIGAAFVMRKICLDDTTVEFEIWDTAGQERYHSYASMNYDARAAIVVYDITNPDTFGKAKTWVKELQQKASPNIVIALAGNKADLSSKRMVEYEVGLLEVSQCY
ncbi:hypothetical protein ACROYT_G012372 [Oculina patagonica]